jgi:hypothetical protein
MADSAVEVMEATDGFVTDIDGERYIVNKGTTRVSSGHILVQRYPHLFKSVSQDLSFGDEMATENPGEQRQRPPAQASSARARTKTSATSTDKAKE